MDAASATVSASSAAAGTGQRGERRMAIPGLVWDDLNLDRREMARGEREEATRGVSL